MRGMLTSVARCWFCPRFRSRLPPSGRLLRALAAALALLAAATAAPAQTSVKLVSTTGQPSSPASLGSSGFAQAFTVGDNPAVLTRVDWKFKRNGTSPATLDKIAVTIRQNSSGTPGPTLFTLTDPDSLPSDGLAQFTAPDDGIELDAGATYWVVFDRDETFSDQLFETNDSNDEDDGAEAGWSIADDFRYLSGFSSVRSETMLIAIHGYSLDPRFVGNGNFTPAGRSITSDQAMSFTTGSYPSGYKLTQVNLRMLGGSGTPPSYTLSVHEDSSDSPASTALGTLTNPDSWPGTARPATASPWTPARPTGWCSTSPRTRVRVLPSSCGTGRARTTRLSPRPHGQRGILGTARAGGLGILPPGAPSARIRCSSTFTDLRSRRCRWSATSA